MDFMQQEVGGDLFSFNELGVNYLTAGIGFKTNL